MASYANSYGRSWQQQPYDHNPQEDLTNYPPEILSTRTMQVEMDWVSGLYWYAHSPAFCYFFLEGVPSGATITSAIFHLKKVTGSDIQNADVVVHALSTARSASDLGAFPLAVYNAYHATAYTDGLTLTDSLQSLAFNAAGLSALQTAYDAHQQEFGVVIDLASLTLPLVGGYPPDIRRLQVQPPLNTTDGYLEITYDTPPSALAKLRTRDGETDYELGLVAITPEEAHGIGGL